MAVINRPPSNKLLFLSDRGMQYACHEFANLIESHKNVERIMSSKGYYLHNASFTQKKLNLFTATDTELLKMQNSLYLNG